MALTPIVELGVSEAYTILTEHFGVTACRRWTRSKMKTGGGTISSADSWRYPPRHSPKSGSA